MRRTWTQDCNERHFNLRSRAAGLLRIIRIIVFWMLVFQPEWQLIFKRDMSCVVWKGWAGLKYLLINRYLIHSLILCETEKCFSIGTRDRTEGRRCHNEQSEWVCVSACVRACVCECVRERACECVCARARSLSESCAACSLQQRHTGQLPNSITALSVKYWL